MSYAIIKCWSEVIGIGRKMENGKKEGVYVQGSAGTYSQRVNFRAFVTCSTKALSWPSVDCGTKWTRSWLTSKMEVLICFDEISDAKMLCNEDKRAIAVKET